MAASPPASGSIRLKELKVRIPVNQHVRLHTIKLSKGVTIGEVVSEAIERYLAAEDS